MTKKKKREIAGGTYDKWLEKTERQPVQKEVPIKYSNTLIAFLDVLGIRSLIEENKRGKEYRAIDKIEEMRKIVRTSTGRLGQSTDFNFLHISDAFVFMCQPEDIILLIEVLSTIQTRIINECQFLLRGAITIGDAIIREDGKFIIGPAYIQAYQLQENDAIYPRIIVDKSVIKEIEKSGKPIDKYLQQDSDKEYFVDYIKVYMQNESLSKQDIRIKLRREDIFNCLRTYFKEHYEKENHNISQKYGWTIQYYKKLGVWEDE